MKNLRCLSAVITLLAFLNTTSADCGDIVLYGKFKEAILTEETINNLQNIFYPNSGSVISEIELDLWVISDCCEAEYLLHITTNLWDIKSYLKKFLAFLTFTDVTFYKVMSTLANTPTSMNAVDNFLPYVTLNLDVQNFTDPDYINPQFGPCLESLFSWVSDYLNRHSIITAYI